MTCFGMSGVTVAVLGAAINGLLAYKELEIYKDQRANLELLTDENMARGATLHGFDQTVKGMHQSVYDGINGLPILEACCEDSKRVIPSIMSASMWAYADAFEEMSGSQAGLKSALYSRSTRIAGKAVARQAAVHSQDLNLEWETRFSKSAAIAGSGSPHNPHNTIANNMAFLADSAAERLNTSSTLFSSFSRESFRDLGYAWALHSKTRGTTSATQEQIDRAANDPMAQTTLISPTQTVTQPVTTRPLVGGSNTFTPLAV